MDTDWAYLEKFRLENNPLINSSDDNRIVFIGDSIIAGWKQHTLFVENPNYINRGINGQTTSQIVHRFSQDVIDLKPKCVVVLVGTNDIAENLGPVSLEEMQDNFRSMIEAAQSNNIQIILCSILPVQEYYWNKKIKPSPKIKVLNTFLYSLANQKTIFYLDFYTLMAEDTLISSKFSDDGVHPNSIGYDFMTEILKNSNYF